MVRITMFRMLEVNQRLSAIWTVVFQEQKKAKSWEEQCVLWHFHLSYSHFPPSGSTVALKTDSWQSQWKQCGLAGTGGSRVGWCSFKVSFQENYPYLTCQFGSVEGLICKMYEYLTWLRAHPVQKVYFQVHLSRTIRGNCLSVKLPEVAN